MGCGCWALTESCVSFFTLVAHLHASRDRPSKQRLPRSSPIDTNDGTLPRSRDTQHNSPMQSSRVPAGAYAAFAV